jgi:hypothetical protein
MTFHVDPAVEYAVILEGGTIFYTGGFEDVDTLRNSMNGKQTIAGTVSAGTNNVPWLETWIDPARVIAIIDGRVPIS